MHVYYLLTTARLFSVLVYLVANIISNILQWNGCRLLSPTYFISVIVLQTLSKHTGASSGVRYLVLLLFQHVCPFCKSCLASEPQIKLISRSFSQFWSRVYSVTLRQEISTLKPNILEGVSIDSDCGACMTTIVTVENLNKILSRFSTVTIDVSSNTSIYVASLIDFWWIVIAG